VALAGAALFLVSAGAVLVANTGGGDDSGDPAAGGGELVELGGGGGDSANGPVDTPDPGAPEEHVFGGQVPAEKAPVWESSDRGPLGEFRAAAAPQGDEASVPPSSGRVQDVAFSLELRVADADSVSRAANDAMRSIDRLGGHVVASSISSRGDEGRARLALRVPVNRLEDAVLRLSALGTITAQDVQVEDLQGRVDRLGNQIESLRRAIRRDELRLASGTLDPDERLEVQLRLETNRARLRALARARGGVLRQGAQAEITLDLHTRAAAEREPDEEGIGGTARDAWNLLAGAGAVALFALIVLSPLIVLALLAWALLRARNRRIDQRLLDEPRPAGVRPPS
jgi:hypothetical protein